MTNTATVTTDFLANLPRRPYCSDSPKELGVIIRPLSTALTYRYIQHNPPPYVSSLVFDIDRAFEYEEWRDLGLPVPHWVSWNRQSLRCHVGYILATPVARTSAARQKPLRYLAAIEYVLSRRIRADMGYVGLLTKNPTHSDWLTVWHQIEPYTLDYLAEFCPDADLAAYSRRSRREASGLGRNVTLFDDAREWAYSAVREYWRPNGYEAWAEAVRDACEGHNVFGLECGGSLPSSEVKATAKSIARWVWRHFTPAKFSAIQAARGAKGGRVSKGGGRPSKAPGLMAAVLKLKAEGLTNRDIADELGIGSATVSRYLAKAPKA